MEFDDEIEDSLRICEELFAHIDEKKTAPAVETTSAEEPKTVTEHKIVEKPIPEEKPEPKLSHEPIEDDRPVLTFASVEETTAEEETEEHNQNQKNKNIDSKKKKNGLTLEKATENTFHRQIGEGEEYNEAHPTLHLLLNCLICIMAALLLSLIITKFVAHHTSVEGSSMESTLHSGDQLIVEKMSYYFTQPDRFDVIVFPYADNVSYIKRIIGLPGETIQIINGKIYIDGKILEENYGRETIEDPGLAAEEILLGEDEFFVLGDNRNASEDSRKAEVGTVKRSDIQGRAWIRFYPFDSFGTVK